MADPAGLTQAGLERGGGIQGALQGAPPAHPFPERARMEGMNEEIQEEMNGSGRDRAGRSPYT